jgi:1-deoxy-D-xylulose-5-phosphate reductoisomerase
VAQLLPRHIKIVGLGVRQGWEKMLKQAELLGVKHVAVWDEKQAELCKQSAPSHIKVYSGSTGMEELAQLEEADIVLCAIVGIAGLKPLLSAIKAGKEIALATKEVIVAAGEIIRRECKKRNVRIIPVDSEHNAIFQCLGGRTLDEGTSENVHRLILTASGGPFACKRNVNFNKVTLKEVLQHPTWRMGKKITIDSATLMNKGLEIIEARWLFGIPIERIDVVIHPESIVHSFVEYVDGTMIALLSVPDMRFAIQYALSHPLRLPSNLPKLDLTQVSALHFMEVNAKRFPCLNLAREAGMKGGTAPAVLNAANEVAVQKFMKGEIKFSGIWKIVESVLSRHISSSGDNIEEILNADTWARQEAEKIRC